ncbi:MAG: hypothetical protein ABIO49_05065 [Dokdonella sp.]
MKQSVLTLAGSSSAATAATFPLLGHWAVDVSRPPGPPEARPKSVAISFSDAGGGKWTTRVDIIDGAGSKSIAIVTQDREALPQKMKAALPKPTLPPPKLPRQVC